MSLYYEAAQILDIARKEGGSFKSLAFSGKSWKSERKALFALTIETTKWSDILAEALEKSDVLKVERQLTPTVSLLLAHDLLLSRKGLALPHQHKLSVAITRHKARLAAELTKVRLRHGFTTLDALRTHIDERGDIIQPKYSYPRWIRINTLRTSLHEQLDSTFAGYERTDNLNDVVKGISDAKWIYIDEHIPDLVAISPRVEIINDTAYKEGILILQDKASCFPAYLLQPCFVDGDFIDACAAPGNKTTHLAALAVSAVGGDRSGTRGDTIMAFEKDGQRVKTLQKMVQLAGVGDLVCVKTHQDFLKLDPQSVDFVNVYALLLDPSCSGSGILLRDEVQVNIRLPASNEPGKNVPKGKKRKHNGEEPSTQFPAEALVTDTALEELPTKLKADSEKLQARLTALSAFQLHLLEHAMSFPAARRITYSTCSIHKEENEYVIVKALMSDIATQRGWRIMKRTEQVEGLRKWHRRGELEAVAGSASTSENAGTALDAEVVADACIRCDKGGPDGTMGFFAAGFVRDDGLEADSSASGTPNQAIADAGDGYEDAGDEWNGFSDNET